MVAKCSVDGKSYEIYALDLVVGEVFSVDEEPYFLLRGVTQKNGIRPVVYASFDLKAVMAERLRLQKVLDEERKQREAERQILFASLLAEGGSDGQ